MLHAAAATLPKAKVPQGKQLPDETASQALKVILEQDLPLKVEQLILYVKASELYLPQNVDDASMLKITRILDVCPIKRIILPPKLNRMSGFSELVEYVKEKAG